MLPNAKRTTQPNTVDCLERTRTDFVLRAQEEDTTYKEVTEVLYFLQMKIYFMAKIQNIRLPEVDITAGSTIIKGTLNKPDTVLVSTWYK